MSPPRYQRRKEERPQEITAAAFAAFAENGYAATKVEDVARRAGVSKGLLYLYFKTKEELFKAVIRSVVAPRIDELARALDSSELGAEAFIRGYWDCDDLVSLVRIFCRGDVVSQGGNRGWARLAAPFRRAAHLLRRNTVRGSRRNIAAHYDLGDDFFSLFLDETMAYSCGLFASPETSLHDAQKAKFDRLLRSIDLQPGEHLVEIGTEVIKQRRIAQEIQALLGAIDLEWSLIGLRDFALFLLILLALLAFLLVRFFLLFLTILAGLLLILLLLVLILLLILLFAAILLILLLFVFLLFLILLLLLILLFFLGFTRIRAFLFFFGFTRIRFFAFLGFRFLLFFALFRLFAFLRFGFLLAFLLLTVTGAGPTSAMIGEARLSDTAITSTPCARRRRWPPTRNWPAPRARSKSRRRGASSRTSSARTRRPSNSSRTSSPNSPARTSRAGEWCAREDSNLHDRNDH